MRALIADDHQLVRDALKRIIATLDPDFEFLECDNYSEALDLAARYTELDVAVLDLRMPGMSVDRGITEFHRQCPQTPLIIVSGYFAFDDVVRAFKFGAAGFIPKRMKPDSMLNAFSLVLAGEKFIPAEMISCLAKASGRIPNEDIGAGKQALSDLLSKRELEVFGELRKGQRNKQIAAKLDISEATVKLHLSNIYRKMGTNNRTSALNIANQLDEETE